MISNRSGIKILWNFYTIEWQYHFFFDMSNTIVKLIFIVIASAVSYKKLDYFLQNIFGVY